MQAVKNRDQPAQREYDDGNEVGVRLRKGRLPSAQKQQRRDRRDGHHVGVLGHEKSREAHAAVFGVEAGHQFVFGFRQIERHAIGFRETRQSRKWQNPTISGNTFQRGMNPSQ